MTIAYDLNDLCFQYNSKQVLDIKQGQIAAGNNTAILGANGSGKTTLFNLMSFLEMPTSGKLHFFDQVITESNRKQERMRVAYVQQKPYLFNLSVKENIELPLKLRGLDKQTRSVKSEQVMQNLSILNLAERRAHSLSGGEVQKVALARALIIEPKVLILDEPFSHLDKDAIAFLENLILDLKNDPDTSVIFSLHDHLKAHYLADQVFNMVDGHLLPSAMMNLFNGQVDKERATFSTGKIDIVIPEHEQRGTHLALDSKQLVLSRMKLESSMRNQFQGRVVAMHEHDDQVRISINAGETFQAIITHAALRELSIHMGDEVWVSFKSSAVSLF